MRPAIDVRMRYMAPPKWHTQRFLLPSRRCIYVTEIGHLFHSGMTSSEPGCRGKQTSLCFTAGRIVSGSLRAAFHEVIEEQEGKAAKG
jgi:hypothetical protein